MSRQTKKEHRMIYAVVFFVIPLLLFTACKRGEEPAIALADDARFQEFALPTTGYVDYFERDFLIYEETAYADVEGSEEPELKDTFYLYRFEDDASVSLWELEGGTAMTDSFARYGDKLYTTYVGSENNALIEIDPVQGTAKQLYQWPAGKTALSYVYTLGDGLILFYTESDLEVTKYVVETVNPANGEVKEFLTETLDNRNDRGIVMPCMYVEDGHLYVYAEERGKQPGHWLRVYDETGELVQEHSLDLDDFLVMEEGTGDDTIWTIGKEGDYFILTTLNGRTIMFREEGDHLEYQKIPALLHDSPVSSCRLLSHAGAGNDRAYFMDPYKAEGNFYVFDAASSAFTPYSLPVANDESGSIQYEYSRNDDGDLLLQVHNLSQMTASFYLMDADALDD